jgi:hypothetical protein
MVGDQIREEMDQMERIPRMVRVVCGTREL